MSILEQDGVTKEKYAQLRVLNRVLIRVEDVFRFYECEVADDLTFAVRSTEVFCVVPVVQIGHATYYGAANHILLPFARPWPRT